MDEERNSNRAIFRVAVSTLVALVAGVVIYDINTIFPLD